MKPNRCWLIPGTAFGLSPDSSKPAADHWDALAVVRLIETWKGIPLAAP